MLLQDRHSALQPGRHDMPDCLFGVLCYGGLNRTQRLPCCGAAQTAPALHCTSVLQRCLPVISGLHI
jgi:hypothetical protein